MAYSRTVLDFDDSSRTGLGLGHGLATPWPDHQWGWWGWSLMSPAPIGARTASCKKNHREKICSVVKFLPSGVLIRPAVLPQYSQYFTACALTLKLLAPKAKPISANIPPLLYPVYTMKLARRAASWMFAILHHSNDQIASSSSQLYERTSCARRASSSSQLHRVNGVLNKVLRGAWYEYARRKSHVLRPDLKQCHVTGFQLTRMIVPHAWCCCTLTIVRSLQWVSKFYYFNSDIIARLHTNYNVKICSANYKVQKFAIQYRV